MAPILGYWNVRGRAGVIRMLLHHTGAEFEDKQYLHAADPDSWFVADKERLGFDFPNLPYLIDGDVKITESRAIIEYLGRKYNLDGKTEGEKIRMGLAMEIMEDVKNNVICIGYVPLSAKNRDEVHATMYKEYEEKIPSKLIQLSKFLGSRKWIAGDEITYVDFVAYEMLDWQRILFSPKYIEAEPNLKAFMKRIEDLPGVKKYIGSSSYIRLPILGPFAMFGNAKDWKSPSA